MSFIYRDQPYLIVPQKLPENMLWHTIIFKEALGCHENDLILSL